MVKTGTRAAHFGSNSRRTREAMQYKRDHQRVHYKKCSYPGCGLTSRKSLDGTTFHRIPVKDSERCMNWLLHCGLDDWVEMTNTELHNKYICSRHFLKVHFHPTGLLRRNAVPKMYFGDEDDDDDGGVVYGDNDTGNVVEACPSIQEHSAVKRRVTELEEKLEQEKNKCNTLRLQLRAKSRALERLRTKVNSGCLNDSYLTKAIATRVSGFAFTFVSMLLFNGTKRRMYVQSEKDLCMSMHCTSPALYSKMRDVFHFDLPSPVTVIRWLSDVNNIWPSRVSSRSDRVDQTEDSSVTLDQDDKPEDSAVTLDHDDQPEDSAVTFGPDKQELKIDYQSVGETEEAKGETHEFTIRL